MSILERYKLRGSQYCKTSSFMYVEVSTYCHVYDDSTLSVSSHFVCNNSSRHISISVPNNGIVLYLMCRTLRHRIMCGIMIPRDILCDTVHTQSHTSQTSAVSTARCGFSVSDVSVTAALGFDLNLHVICFCDSCFGVYFKVVSYRYRVIFFIRAKRVSNCYMQEKKN